jgi:hypothetical protein
VSIEVEELHSSTRNSLTHKLIKGRRPLSYVYRFDGGAGDTVQKRQT